MSLCLKFVDLACRVSSNISIKNIFKKDMTISYSIYLKENYSILRIKSGKMIRGFAILGIISNMKAMKIIARLSSIYFRSLLFHPVKLSEFYFSLITRCPFFTYFSIQMKIMNYS